MGGKKPPEEPITDARGTPRNFNEDPPEGFSHDPENPNVKTIKKGDSVLDYTKRGETLNVDWTERDIAGRLRDVQNSTDGNFRRIEGYTVDKLGGASDEAVKKLSRQVVSKLKGTWKVIIKTVDNKRTVVFERTD